MALLSTTRRLAAAVAVSLFCTASIAHAGAAVGTPVPAQVLSITAQQAAHVKCVYQDGVCVYAIYHTLEVDGRAFSPGGEVIIYLQDGQTGTTLRHIQIGTSPLFGTFTLDTGNHWCTAHGWKIKAFDVTRRHFVNTLTIAPCTAP